MLATGSRRIVGAGCLAAAAAIAGIFTDQTVRAGAAAETCVSTHGYWTQHEGAWPVTALILGNSANPAHTYSKSELLQILGASTKGDASVNLAQQEIAAKLNIARGSNPAPVASILTTADTLLGAFAGKLPDKVSPASSIGSSMVAAAGVLADYNAGKLPNSCGSGNANRAPVANAGPDQSVALGAVVTLNGSRSSDADGNTLTFTWSLLSRPGSSTAALSDPHAVMPTFTADVPGAYDVQLIVNDGTVGSAPDTVRVSTENSRPVANAGPDQSLAVASVAHLDGSSSSDPDGDSLTFTWSFVSIPAGSSAALLNPTDSKPTFTIDVPGNYTAKLIVSDGLLSSAPDTVTISTINSSPSAKAGPDQTAAVSATVTLDGSLSSDVDGDPLTFAWSFVSRPAGSQAALTTPTSVRPTFVLDAPGTYVAQLVVNDGKVNSAPDTVTIATTNSQPVAKAGPDQSVSAGATVELDGSGSTDVDGNPLTFAWALTTRPAGSLAALSNAAAVKPTFVADRPGDYIAQLTVNDGVLDSAPDTVTITTVGQNHPPTANAGSNRTVALGTSVQLDGSASSDPDSDPLTFKWSLVSVPNGSAAVLSGATSVNPTFIADTPGSYVAQLIVNDGKVDSPPRTVTISTENSAPTANPGPNQTVAPNATVHLDGSASADPDGTPLTYSWSLLSAPPGSAAALSNPTSVTPTFVADLTGVYVAQLIVSDGVLFSAPVTVTVTVSDQTPADLQLSFFNAPTNPPIGADVDFFVTLANHGPGVASDVTVQFALPAGYRIRSIRTGVGSYDPATGIWTIASLPFGSFDIAASLTINASGPYDLAAAVTHSSAPDPDLSNNTVTAHVSPNPNADLSISFFNPPAGFHTPGTDVDFFLIVQNLGPSSAAGISAHFQLPTGYSLFRGGVPTQGSYDPTTGDWAIGIVAGGQQASIGFSAHVNATGPAALIATITGSSQPDPIVVNNVAAPPPINRPPVPRVGADQTTATNTPVSLDGTQSLDPDGDTFTYQWTFAIRPINSLATIANANTATPSFVPDLGGRYVPQLTLIDSHGVASLTPAKVTITANELNHAPVIRSTPVTTAAVGQAYAYQLAATDPEAGDSLTFSLVAPPTGMTIDSLTGRIAWTPSAAQAGPQPVTVRAQDSGGLFATQTFVVQVSSDSNHAPIANVDSYQVHVNESLGVNAPGVLANDSDLDGHSLSSRLLTPPANGSVSLNSDGSFTYAPFTLQPSDYVLAEHVNLAVRVPGVQVHASSGSPANAIDDNLATNWTTQFENQPWIELVWPEDVTVSGAQIVGLRTVTENRTVTAGILQLFAADGTELYNTGSVELPPPTRDGTFILPNLERVRRVRFSPTAGERTVSQPDEGVYQSGFAELKVIGSALIRRERKPEPNLMQLLPVGIQASSFVGFNIPEAIADDASNTNWYALTANPGEFIEATFPVDVTVTQLETHNASGRPDGFGTSLAFNCSGTLALFDGAGTELFNSGVLPLLKGVPGGQAFSVPVPNIGGVRRARVTIADCTGTQLPPGFSEFLVFGAAAVETPAFSVAKKFQVLTGREVHSTTMVVNLTDDNGDGRIDTNDVPDIVVPVESIGNQLKGEIKVVSGDDGRLLFTAGGPDLVSPWSEVAVGDLDGDGISEIVAVHSDGNHLIAFEHTGALRWISDANAMPRFNIGNSALIGGAVSIANLDGTGRPEIIVGASVFDADGHLVGDGRALGGTTAGGNLLSAISAIADIDLDGVPELVAGPTAYRLTNGQLTKVWQRSDRADGYIAVANFDDDPQAEIVAVAKGFVYMLNHDGTDAEVWNAPTHAPVALPGGGDGGSPLIVDVDGDGIPEIGVAAQTRYTVFNRDGSVRWTSAIMDRSSFSTGSTAFDLDGDGQVEIIYRDQNFLRVFRGTDGVLLAKTPVGSATWAEEPIVADVDNDGHADIVVSSDFQNQVTGTVDTGIIVFQDAANKWTRTRRIWNEHGYHVTNVNEDGTIPQIETPHWLLPGLNAFRINLFAPGETAVGADSFTYVASDGTLESNIATVHIAVRAPNGAPTFSSQPVTRAAGDVPYVYAARASDPDAGDILTFSLPTAPSGMTIDSASGLIRWTPTVGQVGDHDVVVKVRDVRGLFAVQGYTVQVSTAIVVPDVTGRAQASAEATIASAGLTVGSVGTRHSPTAVAGSVLTQTPQGGTHVAPATAVNLVISSGPAPSGTVPDVVGQSQTSAQADITAAGFTAGGVAGQNHATIPTGIVLSQSPAGGSQAPSGSPISLVVSLGPFPGDLDQDHDGFTPNSGDCNDGVASIHPGAFDIPGDGIDQDCNSRDAIVGDTTAPTAAINTPADLATITLPTDIVGTASDANFLRYTLTLGGVDGTPATLASGTSPVVNGVLGRLDPSLLENGLYRVRLIVEDVNGQTSVDERVYRIDGMAKIGNLRLTFNDLSIPVGGIPISIFRTYDSRVKSKEDFGIGWTLDVARGSYRHNRTPGRNWIIQDRPVLGGFLPCIGGSLETKSHLTEVRLSDRESYRFAIQISNTTLGVTGACEGTASFQFVDGTRPGATLDILGSNGVIYLRGGPDTVLDMEAFLEGAEQPFDPPRVRLTRQDGTRIDLDRQGGITRIADPNGNELVITAQGVVYSSGKSISFTRDDQQRITKITDPMGHALVYGYDGAGDLTSFTDQAGSQTTFAYNSRHDLTEIRDALGRPVKYEFDADGRLIALIDALGNRTTLDHDLDARREVQTDRLGDTNTLEYDERGNIVRRVDALGNTTTFAYDGRDNLLSETDPLGHTRTFTYDANDNRLTLTDALNHTTSFTYNGHSQVLSATDARGGASTRAYDSRDNVLAQIDAAGGRVTHAYDAAGNETRTTNAVGGTWTYSFNSAGQVVGATLPAGDVIENSRDANGNVLTETRRQTLADGSIETSITKFSYDANNRRIRIVNAGNAVHEATYTATGQLATRFDPCCGTTNYTYDEQDRLIRAEFPDGTRESSTYDAEGRVESSTDRAGRVTHFSYDALGRLLTTTFPDGATIASAYDAAGRKISQTDELGRMTSFIYDANDRLLTTRDPLGGTTVSTYDESGNLASRTDRNGHATTFAYDAANRLLKTTLANGTSVAEAYDAQGRRVSETDQAGNLTRFEYDTRGALTRVVDPIGNATQYGFNQFGKRVSQTDRLGNTTQFGYDLLGRRTLTTLPLGQTEARTYDEAGQLMALRNYNGDTIRYTYDSMNRLATRTLPDGQVHRFTYTATGKMASVVDANGTTTFEYDDRDRPTLVHSPDGATVRYTYDAAGNRTSVVTPGGTVAYVYDADNRLVELTDFDGRHSTLDYDGQGNLTHVRYANGVVATYAYDTLNRVTGVTHTKGAQTLRSFQYTLGAAGNRTRVVEDTGRTVDYAYDQLFRLTQETITAAGGGTLSLAYSYDAAGNRTSRSGPGGTISYTYDANNRLLQAGPAAFTYDGNGNQIGKVVGTALTSYTYDSLNRLLQTSSSAGITQYAYDALGHRLAKTDAAGTTRYVLDQFGTGGLSQVLRETSSTGAVDYVYGGGVLVSRRQPAGTSFYLHDARMSARMLADETGAVTDRFNYDAFGNVLDRDGTTANEYLFDAQRFDPDSGFYDLRARQYDPVVGRFTGVDPFPGTPFDPASLHPYTYAYNDPVNKSDPSGKFTLLEQATIAAGVGTLAGIGYAAENYYYYRSAEQAFDAGVDAFFSFGQLTLDVVGLGGVARTVLTAVAEGVGEALASKALTGQTARNIGKTAKDMLSDVLEGVLCRTNNVLKCVVVSAEKGANNPAVEGVYKVIKQEAITVGKQVLEQVVGKQAEQITVKEAAEVAPKAIQQSMEVIFHRDDIVFFLEELVKSGG